MSANLTQIRLPWQTYDEAKEEIAPHQDGTEPIRASKGDPPDSSRRKKADDDAQAVKRALDLYKVYKEGKEEEALTATKDKATPSRDKEDADQVLHTMIDALVRIKEEEDMSQRIARWTNEVQKETSTSAQLQDKTASARKDVGSAPSQSSSYPDVIPLEALNAASLVNIAGSSIAKSPEKHNRINDALKSVATDARKNINYVKEDIAGLKAGATATAKTLKGLLKRSKGDDQDDNGESAGTGEGMNRMPRKSVRLQDAAGRGEGPRDESRGETEEQARYRRLSEMARRLNE